MNDVDKFFSKIQNFHEDEFSQQVVIPLYQKMDYDYVDFNGGSYEKGKDIIANKCDEYGEVEVTVIQAKMLKTKRSSVSTVYFGTIVHQLRKCLELKVACADGQKRLPIKTILVTPYDIDTRHLEDELATIELQRVVVIGRAKLRKALDKYWPTVYQEFECDNVKAVKTVSSDFVNSELLSALRVDNCPQYSDYYSDLNFFVGETESSTVFSSKLMIINSKKNNYSVDEWQRLKHANKLVKACIGINLFSSDIEDVESRYKDSLNVFNSTKNQKNLDTLGVLVEQFITKQSQFKQLLQQLDNAVELNISNATVERKSERCSAINEYHESTFFLLQNELGKIPRIEAFGLVEILNTNTILQKCIELDFPKDIEEQVRGLFELSSELEDAIKEKIKLNEKVKFKPEYSVSVDTKGASFGLNRMIISLKNKLITLNSNSLTQSEARAFLDSTNTVLRCLDYLVYKVKLRATGFKLVHETTDNLVLDISAHSLFDSGCDIALYGAAGAGKSTTLHVYADKLYRNKTDAEEIIFMPLNRMIRILNNQDTVALQNILSKNSFESLINCFLLYRGLEYSAKNRHELVKYLKGKQRVVLIIDSLDEASANATWVVNSLAKIKDHIPCAQVITSSRNCVKFIDDIEFLGITLMPFTEPQLKKFIWGWLKEEGGAAKLWKHIQQSKLFEVATNPLLATIICNLHRNNISIPKNEPDIYRKNIELLCGLYDIHKGIERTVNDKACLEDACRKIAFRMHYNEQREATRVQIEQYLFYGYREAKSKNFVSSVVTDLIEICDILRPLPEENTYSFGHLRIQEFLAASYLGSNRSVDIGELVLSDWWVGALYLYGFDSDLQHMIDDVFSKYHNFLLHEKNLKRIIASQPKSRKQQLSELIDRHCDSNFISDIPDLGYGGEPWELISTGISVLE